jgi:hypothetical protein
MAQTFTISDLTGGINNSDSPTELPDNQVVDARNVDFRSGNVGAKRRGTAGIDMAGSAIDSAVIALFRHTPTNSLFDDELWALDENGHLDRRVGDSWVGSVPLVNTNIVISPSNYLANAVSVHGKLFIAARQNEDRTLVWDGTVLRWAGFNQTPPPTVASTGSGTLTGTRYYRVRYIEMAANGITILRRSEPSTSVSFTAPGTGLSARITKPSGTETNTSLYCEGQTHWEIEASLDNVLFYKIATVAIATTTYDDSTAFSPGYATLFPLSESIGRYIPPVAVKYVAVDEDRVMFAGSYFTQANDATVWWTPVNSATGVGNDERVPITTNNYLTLDGLDGGSVNALVAGVAGNVYALKHQRIYKLARTGVAESAYAPIPESFTRGCDPLGACAGTDENGLPCLYFVDSAAGLCRLGRTGVQDLARAIRRSWFGHNPNPAITPRIIYYPALDQVWYLLPASDGDTVLSADDDEVLTADNDTIVTAPTVPLNLVMFEVRKGGLIFFDGIPGQALALAIYHRRDGFAPIFGTQSLPSGNGNFSYIHEGDTGTTDSSTPFRAYVRTRPYMLGGLWGKFGLMAAVVIAKAASGAVLFINMLRNFGVESRSVSVSLTPFGSEASVIKPIDNASLSDLNAIQLEIGDEEASAQEFDLDRIVFKVRQEEGSC